jgi:hypothetical protein
MALVEHLPTSLPAELEHLPSGPASPALPSRCGAGPGAAPRFRTACRASALVLIRQGRLLDAAQLLEAAERPANENQGSHGVRA